MLEDLKKFADENLIPFMEQNGLVTATVSNGLGDKVTVKRDKHGFYRINFTMTEDKRVK